MISKIVISLFACLLFFQNQAFSGDNYDVKILWYMVDSQEWENPEDIFCEEARQKCLSPERAEWLEHLMNFSPEDLLLEWNRRNGRCSSKPTPFEDGQKQWAVEISYPLKNGGSCVKRFYFDWFSDAYVFVVANTTPVVKP